ncbi:MAG: binding-protein-dependent transport system inner rane component [Eubacterium sp.]|nr:binding-protein-dependent transport system inner rane component [Eubacterium sp.]
MVTLKKTADYIALNIISYVVVGFFALFTVFPFILLVVNSFTSEHYILNYGFSIIPRELSLDAYSLIFIYPERIIRAYGVTIFITAVGTIISLFLSSMAAYVMFRKEIKYRNALAFFIFFTTLFNGGLAPYYIIVSNTLHLQDNLLVLLLVPMFSAMNILILRNFIKGSIPDSLVESAKIDGAGDFRIFIQMILPLSKAALASIGLFTALGYWNDWWTPMMFMQNDKLFPLQYVLYQILSSANMSSVVSSYVSRLDMPKETLKLAMTVISAGPIVFLYPFVQKYFVKGVTIGAVKG